MVWDCQGAKEDTYFFLDPHRPSPVLTIPVGTLDLRFEGKAGAPVALLLIDPATRTIVAGDNGGIISSFQPSGTYAGMQITCFGGELGAPLSKSCQVVGETTTPLVLQLVSSGTSDQDVIGSLSFSYAGISPCPAAPVGCAPYDTATACEEVRDWSGWAQAQYGTSRTAWTALAEAYSMAVPRPGVPVAQTPRAVPWFLWDGVWREWHATAADGYRAFRFLDTNGDLSVSQEEFALGYDFSGVGRCRVPAAAGADGSGSGSGAAPGGPRAADAAAAAAAAAASEAAWAAGGTHQPPESAPPSSAEGGGGEAEKVAPPGSGSSKPQRPAPPAGDAGSTPRPPGPAHVGGGQPPAAAGVASASHWAPREVARRFLQAWWSSWVPWALLGALLWAAAASAVLLAMHRCRARGPAKHEEDTPLVPGPGPSENPVVSKRSNDLGGFGDREASQPRGSARQLRASEPREAWDEEAPGFGSESTGAPQGPAWEAADDESFGEQTLEEGPHTRIFHVLKNNAALRKTIEAHPASLRFHQMRLLGYGDRLTDGFRALFSEEILLVDGRKDSRDTRLRGLLAFLRQPLSPSKAGAPAGSERAVSAAAMAVALALGGAVAHEDSERARELEARWRLRRPSRWGSELPEELPIGHLLGTHKGAEGALEPGAGLQRHRAVLFKYVCDTLGVCDSALLWDARRDVALNVAWAGGRPMLVDLFLEPGALEEDFELHELLLKMEGGQGTSRGGPAGMPPPAATW